MGRTIELYRVIPCHPHSFGMPSKSKRDHHHLISSHPISSVPVSWMMGTIFPIQRLFPHWRRIQRDPVLISSVHCLAVVAGQSSNHSVASSWPHNSRDTDDLPGLNSVHNWNGNYLWFCTLLRSNHAKLYLTSIVVVNSSSSSRKRNRIRTRNRQWWQC